MEIWGIHRTRASTGMEYLNDIPSAQKLFASGVPVAVMPLDSTQLKLDEVNGRSVQPGTPITDALTLLYHQWVRRRRLCLTNDDRLRGKSEALSGSGDAHSGR